MWCWEWQWFKSIFVKAASFHYSSYLKHTDLDHATDDNIKCDCHVEDLRYNYFLGYWSSADVSSLITAVILKCFC